MGALWSKILGLTTGSVNGTDSGTEKGQYLYLSGCSPGHYIVPECEVFEDEEESSELKSLECKKNPGHGDFIPVRDFKIEHLPEQMRRDDIMIKIQDTIDRTVLIRVKYTSINRPDTYHDSKTQYPFAKFRGSRRVPRVGTGTIVSYTASKPVIGNCPCPDCEKSGIPQSKYWKYRVTTATHVVFDDSEAKKAVIKCFFDSEENEDEVVLLYGVRIKSGQSQDELLRTDMCDNLICVTHDETCAETIKSRIQSPAFIYIYPVTTHGFMVSHPHGLSKMISIGKHLYTTIPIQPDHQIGKREEFPFEVTCHLEVSPSEYDGGTLPTSPNTSLKFGSSTSLTLPKGTTFTLPPGAEYAMRYGGKKDFSFPPGTTFHNATDGTAIPIPDTAVFESTDFKSYLAYKPNTDSYDVPTCPGSSGALVPCHLEVGDVEMFTPNPHCGSDGEGKCNRSCITNHAIRDRFIKEAMRDREKEYDSDLDSYSESEPVIHADSSTDSNSSDSESESDDLKTSYDVETGFASSDSR